MINKKNKIKEESNLSSFSDNKCDKKIAKLNKKLEETIEQLQEIKNLYAEAEWETLTKEKKITQIVNQIEELKKDNAKLKAKITNKKIIISKKNVFIPENICSIATDSEGNIYIGTKISSWSGAIYRCLAGESEFKPMFGIYGEVWVITIDSDENIYIGTNEGSAKGSVYKCLKNENSFKKMAGINKSISSLTFDNDNNIYVGISTGSSHWNNDSNFYKCLAGQLEFKPMTGIKGEVISLTFNKNTNILYATTLNETWKNKTNDCSIYKCLLTNNTFTLVKRNFPRKLYLKTKDSEPFI